MPSVSQAQAGFMAMSKTAKGRAKLRAHGIKAAPASVANEYLKADTGQKTSKLPKHVLKRK